jgi:hypothetical protein
MAKRWGFRNRTQPTFWDPPTTPATGVRSVEQITEDALGDASHGMRSVTQTTANALLH